MLREAKRFQKQLELSQTREEVQYSTQSAFTPVISQGKCCHRDLFEQESQSYNPRQDPSRFLPESRGGQPMEIEHYPNTREECPIQRSRDQVVLKLFIGYKWK